MKLQTLREMGGLGGHTESSSPHPERQTSQILSHNADPRYEFIESCAQHPMQKEEKRRHQGLRRRNLGREKSKQEREEDREEEKGHNQAEDK